MRRKVKTELQKMRSIMAKLENELENEKKAKAKGAENKNAKSTKD